MESMGSLLWSQDSATALCPGPNESNSNSRIPFLLLNIRFSLLKSKGLMLPVYNHIIFRVLLFSLNFRRTVVIGFFYYRHCLSGSTSILPKSAIEHYPYVVPSFFPNYIFPQSNSILVVQVFFFPAVPPLRSIFYSWRDSPIVGLGLLLIHEDFCGF
jgi:hypothetical protein